MKTMIFLISLLASLATNAQNLLTNGNFESGMIDWFGNGFNVQTNANNSYNMINIDTTGNPSDVNLSQGIEIIQNETYILTFNAWSDGNRTINAGIGLNEAPFDSMGETISLTNQNQTFTLVITANNFGSINSKVLFDMGADTGIVIIDNVSLVLQSPDLQPQESAPIPPERSLESVFSMYSDAYNNHPGVVLGAFNQGTQSITELDIEGDNFLQLKYSQPGINFFLIDWGTAVDNQVMTHFHMDIWIDTDFTTNLIANPYFSNLIGNNDITSIFGITNPVNTFGEWISIDIPLNEFIIGDSNQQRDALKQFMMTVVGSDTGIRTVYLDNLYLYNNRTLSIEESTTLDFNIYPNPTNGLINIKSNRENIRFSLIEGSTGKILFKDSFKERVNQIDLSRYSSGLYFLMIQDALNGQVLTTHKLIKQ